MTSQRHPTDLRLAGAVLALAHDVAMLGVAGLLVLASLSAAFGLVLAGLVGLVVAPMFGWMYGRAAANPRPSRWAIEAQRRVLLVGFGITIGVVAFQALTVPADGGIVGRLALVAYSMVMDTLAIGLLTSVSVLLVGVPWLRVMRWLGRAMAQT